MKPLNKKARDLMLALAVAAFLPLSMLPAMALSTTATPEIEGSINAGYIGKDANFATNGFYNINAADGAPAGTVINSQFKTFNVGENVTVRHIANNYSQIFLDQVNRSGGVSQILGKITTACAVGSACGYDQSASVILINPNGIYFGPKSHVNVNSFTASTFDINGTGKIKSDALDYITNAKAGGVTVTHTYTDAEGNPVTAYGYNDFGTGVGSITGKFGAGKLINFEQSGIAVDANGNGAIVVDGGNINYNWDTTGKILPTDATSVALIGNRIDVKNGAVIRTFEQSTGYNIEDVTRSNVKLITADGVTFKYDVSGNVVDPTQDVQVKTTAVANSGINITGDSFIKSGSVQITNAISDSDINISGSTITAKKLNNASSGSIVIEAPGTTGTNGSKGGNITIKQSNIQTYNSAVADDNKTGIGSIQHLGDITIAAKKNIEIQDTRIRAYDSELNSNLTAGNRHGNVNIVAGGDIDINQYTYNEWAALNPGKTAWEVEHEFNKTLNANEWNRIIAGGDMKIEAGGNVKIDLGLGAPVTTEVPHKILAQGFADVTNDKNRVLTISGKNVEIKNALVGAGDLNILAGNPTSTDVGGGITVDKTELFAYNNMGIKGFNTTLEDSVLAYNNLVFDNGYNMTDNKGSETEPWKFGNNVKIAGGTTFYDRKTDSGADFKISTNGQLIIDAKGKTDGVLRQIKMTEENTLPAAGLQPGNIVLESTMNQVSIIGGSNLVSNGDVSLIGYTNANVSESSIHANGNINLTGGSKVTVGNLKPDGTVNDSTTLSGVNVRLTSNGNVTDFLPNASTQKGVKVLGSNIQAAVNTEITANGTNAGDGNVEIIASDITSSNNTVINANKGFVKIYEGKKKVPNNLGAVTNNVASNITSGNASSIQGSDVVYVNKSKVSSRNANSLTSTGNNVEINGSTVESTGTSATSGVTINANQKVIANNGTGTSTIISSNGAKTAITATNSDVNLTNVTVTGKGVDITSGKAVVGINDSTINGNGNTTNLTATEGLITLNNTNVTSKDVNLTQKLTANINTKTLINGSKVNATNGNIKVNVTGDTKNINAGDLSDFSYNNGRLILQAANDVVLSKTAANGNWNVARADLIAGNSATVQAANGSVTLDNTSFDSKANSVIADKDVTINNLMDIKKGDTTIKSTNGNIYANSTNAVINVNNQGLTTDAAQDTKIAIKGANNTAKGLRINSSYTTSQLDGKDVEITIKDTAGRTAIANIKADTLAIKDAYGAVITKDRLAAATNTMTAKENTAGIAGSTGLAEGSAAVTASDYQNKAYIEVKKLGGFNMDPYYAADAMPSFYNSNDHYVETTAAVEGVDGYAKHFINFEGNPSTSTNLLLVYTRKAGANCGPVKPQEPAADPTPGVVPTPATLGLDESTFVRLPRHEEGVSLVAPVQNAITDPTANVIMAAARINVDDTNSYDMNDDDDFGSF